VAWGGTVRTGGVFETGLLGRSLDLHCATDRQLSVPRYNTAMFRVPTTCLAGLAVFLASCGQSGTGESNAAAESAIRLLDEQWSATAAKNDLDGTVGFYSDDAVLLPPNATLAADKKSIRESWSGLLGPNTDVSWKATKVEVARSGELGYLYGTYQLSIKDPKGAPPITDKGKILEVWRKQSDGKWKCIADTYNSDIPLPSPSK
jgi:ketosteroid isomerase-like protein